MCLVGDVAIVGLPLCPAQHSVEQTLPSTYVWNLCTEHAGVVRLNCMQCTCSVPWCQHRVCQQGAPVRADTAGAAAAGAPRSCDSKAAGREGAIRGEKLQRRVLRSRLHLKRSWRRWLCESRNRTQSCS